MKFTKNKGDSKQYKYVTIKPDMMPRGAILCPLPCPQKQLWSSAAVCWGDNLVKLWHEKALHVQE